MFMVIFKAVMQRYVSHIHSFRLPLMTVIVFSSSVLGASSK
jgi:hypothetical protein